MLKKISIITLSFVATIPFIAGAATYNRQLQIGMSGSDVSSLQTFLALDSSIYPQGLVTGYYGTLTSSAVARFQAKNGLPAVGRVGPLTLALLNGQGTVGLDDSAAVITNVITSTGNYNVNISWNTNEPAKGVVYYSSTPLSTYEHANSVDISGVSVMTDTSYKTYQSIGISGLSANTTYYYMIYSTDQSGNVSVTTPATYKTQ